MPIISCQLIKYLLTQIRAQRRECDEWRKEARGGKTNLTKAREILALTRTLRELSVSAIELLFIIKGKSRQNREIVYDLRQGLRESREFYLRNGLKQFAEALPRVVTVSEETRKMSMYALANGMDRFLVCPATSRKLKLSREQVFSLVDYTYGHDMVDSFFPESDLPGFPGIDKEIFSKTDLNIPREEAALRQGVHLLFYSSGDLPIELRKLNFSEARERVKNLDLNGMTVSEFCLLQRLEYEKSGNHDFVNGEFPFDEMNATWLLASRKGDWSPLAYWHVSAGHIKLLLWQAEKSLRLGVRTVKIVPIGSNFERSDNDAESRTERLLKKIKGWWRR